MASRWQRPLSLPGLTSAVLLVPPLSSQAGESPTLSAAFEASDVTTGHLFNALLYLPVGLLCAAAFLEYFAQWKKSREIEPGILFLLFGAAGAAVGAAVLALAFSPVGRETGQLYQFATWMGVLAALVGLSFYLKRTARTQKLFSLDPIPALSGRIVVPRTSGQKGLIVGYRITLVVAILTALLGLSEMPLGHAQTKSVAAAMRSVLVPRETTATPVAATTDSGPLPPDVKPAGPAIPKLADLLEKRGPDAPDSTNSLTKTVNASIEGTLPVSPTPSGATRPPEAATVPPNATVPPERAPVTAPPVTSSPTTTPVPPPAAPAAAAPIVASPSANVPKVDKAFFATRIKPILDSKCTSCHGSSKKPKGDLRLDSAAMVRAGANGHPIVVPGNPDTSSLYQRLTATDDEEIMPPKEKGGPLPAPMIAAVKAWILAGADYGDGTIVVASPTTPARPGGRVEEAKSKNLPPPDPATVAALTTGGAVIRPLSANGALLDINLSHFEAGPVKLTQLAPIAKNVYELDVTKTRLKDDDLVPLAQMSNLTRLELKRNMITDAGLVHLKGLVDLESLNLYETQVTDTGLEQLAGLKKLQKLFLFNTKCTAAGANKLKAQIPGLVINLGE